MVNANSRRYISNTDPIRGKIYAESLLEMRRKAQTHRLVQPDHSGPGRVPIDPFTMLFVALTIGQNKHSAATSPTWLSNAGYSVIY